MMEEDLWKHMRQHMRERKIKLEHRMSRVENIARECTIKSAQSLQSLSMRKKASKYATPPRRTTVASSEFSEEKRKEFSLKRDGKRKGRESDSVFREELEDSASPLVIRSTRFGDFIDGGSIGEVFKRSSEMIKEEDEELEEDEAVLAPEKDETQLGSQGEEVHGKSPSNSFEAKPESSQHSNKKNEGGAVKSVSISGFTESLDV